MIYRSEILNKDFATEKECLDAETKFLKREEEKTNAYEKANAALSNLYQTKWEAFELYDEAERKYLEAKLKVLEEFGKYNVEYDGHKESENRTIKSLRKANNKDLNDILNLLRSTWIY